MVAGDLEADGDLDLIFSTQQEGIRLFVNRGNRTFFELTNATGDFGSDDPASDLAIVDLDRDLDLDVVTVHSGSGKVGIIENLLHLQFRGRFLDEIQPILDVESVSIEDIDGNVSWDIIVGGSEEISLVFSQMLTRVLGKSMRSFKRLIAVRECWFLTSTTILGWTYSSTPMKVLSFVD